MTLSDLERCNSPYFAFFSRNSTDFEDDYITVVEDRPIMSVKYCLPDSQFQSSTFDENYNSPCSAVSLRQLSILSLLEHWPQAPGVHCVMTPGIPYVNIYSFVIIS